MRKLIIILYIALLAGIATAQVSKTINCNIAGTLNTLLTKTEDTTVTNLTVTGNIDARDIYFMHDSMPVLAVFDFSNVQIKAYKSYIDNEMPDSSFCNKKTLTSIVLPNSLISIGDSAFTNCTGIKDSLSIPNSVVSIGNYAFFLCSGLIGNLIIPNSIKSIGDHAFQNCIGFTDSLILGNSLTDIGKYAFYQCSYLTGSLIIPNSVNSLGDFAFYRCNALKGSLTISNSIRSIGQGVFGYCNFSGNLTIPNSVTSIEDHSFEACSKFTGNLTIPNSVTSVGVFAFSGCSGFTGNLTIPNSVTFVGAFAFAGCDSLQKIIVDFLVPLTISAYTFLNVNKITCVLVVPKGSKAAYQAADYWNDFYHIVDTLVLSIHSPDPDINSSTSNFILLPNPAIDIITLKGNKMHEVIIYNQLGTVVMQKDLFGENKAEINVNSLKAGSYLVRVKTNDNFSTMKLIKK